MTTMAIGTHVVAMFRHQSAEQSAKNMSNSNRIFVKAPPPFRLPIFHSYPSKWNINTKM